MKVELVQVGKRFGALRALAGVDLALPSGSRTALLGPNGSGKSTLTRALLGLIRYEGEVHFDGVRRDGEDLAIARRIAYLPQVAPRLAATVGDLVRAISRLRGIEPAAIGSLAARLGLDSAAIRRRPLRELSGGMRQKLLAATTLASGAELLVLDEPTASMDPRSRRVFFELVDELDRSTSVLLCSHRLDEIRSLVDSVAVLDEGKLAFAGPSDSFLGGRSNSVVELRVDPVHADTLAGLGFRAGSNGWWSCTVPTEQRAAILRHLFAELGDDIDDLLVQDLEDLDVGVAATSRPDHLAEASR